MKLKDLIPDMSTFMRYAPGVDTSNHIDDLEPSSLVAVKSVTSLVGDRTLRAIIQQQDGELMEALRRAVANRTMASHVSFDSINQRKSGKKLLLTAFTAVVISSAYGGVLELVQPFFPPRTCDLLDFIADTAGAIVGFVITDIAWIRTHSHIR